MRDFGMDQHGKNGFGLLLLLVALCAVFVIALDDVVNETVLLEENVSDNAPVPAEEPLSVEVQNDSLVSEPLVTEASNNPPVDLLVDVRTTLDEYAQKLVGVTLDTLKEDPPGRERRLLIKYLDGVDPGASTRFLDERQVGDLGIDSVRASASELAAVLADEDIELVELDQDLVSLGDMVPYGVNATRAPTVWNQTTGDGVTVAIIDTGIAAHPDLLVAGGISVIGGGYDDMDGHGTAVAGVVAASINDDGLVGVAPDVDLYAVKIMDGSTGQLSGALAGIEWASANDMDIFVMSFGIASYSQLLRDALQDAHDNGALLVAASGNDGENGVLYPAAYASVIAVGALDATNARAAFSNYGAELELVAPGVAVNTTGLDDGYVLVDGTSLAAPHIAGVAALVWSWNASLTNDEVRAKLQGDALDLGGAGLDDEYGYGLVQVNLTSATGPLGNLSYQYEIYNFTEYGLENETLLFWTDGMGTIDDVTFAPGYYLVTKYLDPPVNVTLYVTENGTIIPLANGGNLLFFDNYIVEGNNTDGALWVNDDLNMSLDLTTLPIGVTPDEVDAECYNDNGEPSGQLQRCWFSDNADKTACDASVGVINCSTFTDCTVGAIGQNRSDIVVESSTTYQNHRSRFFYVCSIDDSFYTTYNKYVLIMDQKRSVCVDSAHYAFQGRYGGSSWATYVGPVACSGTCDSSLTQTIISKNTPLTSPCVSCSVNGTINVAVEVDGSGYGGAYILVNNVSKGATDVAGVKGNISLTGVGCNEDQDVTVLCSDNVTICSTKSTQIDLPGDEDNLLFDCSLACGTGSDLYLSQSSVWVNMTDKNITLTVWSKGITQIGVVLNISRQDSSGLIVNSTLLSVNVVAGQGRNVSTTAFQDLDAADYLHAWVDPLNAVTNEDNANNYLFRPVVKDTKLYLTVSVDPTFSSASVLIEEYLSNFFTLVDNGSAADVVVVIRQSDPLFGAVFGPNGQVEKPYGAQISRVYLPALGKDTVYVEGVGFEGIIAGTKRLVNARGTFLSKERNAVQVSFIDNYDAFGISVFDRLHADEADTYFTQPASQGFRNLVRNVLNDNNFEVAIKTVKTLNATSYNQSTILRVKHLNTDFTSDYLDAYGVSPVPVVFSGGIFSTLETWESDDGLASQMAAEGRDVWEIEMNGGPTTDCDDCPNYRYEDLVDYYWPASIAGIAEYSGQNRVDYVGHSNGCRAALSSLNNWSQTGKNNAGYYFDYSAGDYTLVDLPVTPVRRFVGVACPGALNGTSAFIRMAQSPRFVVTRGDWAMYNLRDRNHTTMGEYGGWLLPWPTDITTNFDDAIFVSAIIGLYAASGERISYNLMDFYNDAAIHGHLLDVTAVNVSATYLFAASPDDLIVPHNDASSLNIALNQKNPSNITSANLTLRLTDHVSIKSNPEIWALIKEALK